MLLGTVIGRVWSERQHAGLDGQRMVLVRDCMSPTVLVSIDPLGASVGSRVLVATDQAAQVALGDEVPSDAVVVALVAGTDAEVLIQQRVDKQVD